MPIEQARAAKVDNDMALKAQRVDKLLALCGDNPDIGVTELATQLGVSRTAIYGCIKELAEQGKLHKNGNGW
jgi:DeoR/GlpR family transcriptional regulator of sugar metabolism